MSSCHEASTEEGPDVAKDFLVADSAALQSLGTVQAVDKVTTGQESGIYCVHLAKAAHLSSLKTLVLCQQNFVPKKKQEEKTKLIS